MSQIINKMSNAEYHAHTAFSSSQLKDILRSPAHFHIKNIAKTEAKESTSSMDFGTLVHTLFLEPENFDAEFVIAPKFDRRTKAGKEEAQKWEEENQGKHLITQDDFDKAQGMVFHLEKLSIVKEMRSIDGMSESSFFFTDEVYSLDLRVRPDFHIPPCEQYPNGLIIDLKTTDDARPHAFSSNCAKFAYDLSCAMYREGFQKCYQTDEKPDFIFLVAERETPHCVKQYKASPQFIETGEQRYSYAKAKLAECLLLDEWQGYSTELDDIDMPSYINRNHQEI